jgi:Zn-dependent M28 family amino/carboxypeptidase
MRRYRRICGVTRGAALLLLAVPGCREWSGPDVIPPITAARVLRHVAALADDSMAGRRAGSPFERLAADYVWRRLVEAGLEPGAGEDYSVPFPIPVPVDGMTGLTSQNVVARLDGQGALADDWIVLGAHYDHLGVRETTPGLTAVFNGADDNASGVAALLEAARYLRDSLAGVSGDRRGILFLAFGAEEVGLVGSIHFCAAPLIPMARIAAMVNLDMVGRLRDDLGLLLIGTSSWSGWDSAAASANTETLPLTPNADVKLLERSDQWCFYQAGRPVLLVHTGLHAEYHTPDDDVALLNADGMASVARFTVRVVTLLLTTPGPLAP